MTRWLRSVGYRTQAGGHPLNVDCSEEACRRLEARLEGLAEHTGQKVAIVGQSRGGTFARALAVRRPELVAGIVTLGAPTRLPAARPPAGVAQVGASPSSRRARARSARGAACAASAATTSRDDLGAVSRRTSRTWRSIDAADGIVDWDPAWTIGREREVRASHCGMAVNAEVYQEARLALASFAAPEDGVWAEAA